MTPAETVRLRESLAAAGAALVQRHAQDAALFAEYVYAEMTRDDGDTEPARVVPEPPLIPVLEMASA